MTNNRKRKLQQSGLLLLKHLDTKLTKDNGYPDKPTWGYAFTLLASLTSQGNKNYCLAEKSLLNLSAQDKNDKNYSWEFVIFALKMLERVASNELNLPKVEYRAKGTRMFNWYLLRNVNKALFSKLSLFDKFKLRLASIFYQDNDGMILDEFKTRSLQYHAFCLFVLAEFIEIMPECSWVKNWFLKGVHYSIKQILEDGTSLYIGRGQEQIFGYGALIYALEYCHDKLEPLDEVVLDSVCNKVISYQRDDGSYPLVLRHREIEQPGVSYSQDQPAGWYGYNTLYDYQPFLAYCLIKAGELK